MPVVGNEEIFNTNEEYSPFFSPDTLSLLPSAIATTGWNVGRVANTITKGGTAIGGYEGSGRGGMFKQGINQTINPRHMRRLTRAANIDPSAYGADSKIYTPFNSLSSIGNRLFNRFSGSEHLASNEKVAGFLKSVGGPGTKGENVFSPGTLGRVRSFDKIQNMKAKNFGHVAESIRDINPELHRELQPRISRMIRTGASDDAMRGMYQAGIGQTVTGRLSGQFAGYVAGAENAVRGGTQLAGFQNGLKAETWFTKGANAGMEAVQNGGKLGRFVGSGAVSTGLKAFNIAGWMLMAHDTAELIGKGVASAARLAVEAGKSTMGSINKPVMGMGFKDNTVSATSRQRGVMAIQNSRLNARSGLGSEGAQMHARFG